MKPTAIPFRIASLALCAGLALTARAEQDDVDSLAEFYGGEEMLSIATGTSKPIYKAPSVASIITARDIKAMGAQTLDDALVMVPGLHVSRSAQVYAARYLFRGIVSTRNPEALVLIDGIPYQSVVRGDRNIIGQRIPAQAIARIEVIRGPGSAVYGADAYAGVINVVTKTREHVDGTTVGGGAGSFDSQGLWLQHGADWGPVQTALSLSYYRTDGQRERIAADNQSNIDNVARSRGLPAVSLAPGPVSLSGDYRDLHLDMSYRDWHLRLGHEDRRDIGMGQGVANTLDPQGRFASTRNLADLSYRNTSLSPSWELESHLSYYRNSQEVEKSLHLFPAGAFFGAFPQGFIGNPEYWEDNLRLDVSGVYAGFTGHRLRLGAGAYRADLYRVRESKNFDSRNRPRPGGLTEVSDTPAAFLPEIDRRNRHVFVQDEWQFAQDWELTAGLRRDSYSDFGDTTNPRLALLWSARENLTAKLLYGKAFRAPSFSELYNANNPVTIGNPELEPETIKTGELAFNYLPHHDLQLDFNLYRYKVDGFINFAGPPTNTAQNLGQRRGRGFELAMSYSPSDDYRLLANFSHQRARDEEADHAVGEAPSSQAYLRSEWRLGGGWQTSVQAAWVGERERPATDPRSDLDGYTTVDWLLRREGLIPGLDLSLALRNLSDADVREPSQAPARGATTVPIPDDLPQAGRSAYLELSYRLP